MTGLVYKTYPNGCQQVLLRLRPYPVREPVRGHWLLCHTTGSIAAASSVEFDFHVCVACRFVILLSDDRDYFFILYMVYVGVNMLLAGIALLHWPGSEQLELVNNPDGYQVSFKGLGFIEFAFRCQNWTIYINPAQVC